MKPLKILFLMLLVPSLVLAQGADSLANSRVEQMEQTVAQMSEKLAEQSQKIVLLQKGLKQKAENSDLQTLAEKVEQNAATIGANAAKLNADLSETNSTVAANQAATEASLSQKVWLGSAVAAALLILSILLFVLLRRKMKGSNATIEKIQSAQKALQEESVKLDSKLLELLDRQVQQVATPANAEPDHSLALKVADEIVRIENNLMKMDPEVRGYKQLQQALQRIKNNYLANGYEIVDLIGKEYNDGMPFEARFIPDDTLEEGKRIISGVSRLQINYNGVLIQAPIISVRQNI